MPVVYLIMIKDKRYWSLSTLYYCATYTATRNPRVVRVRKNTDRMKRSLLTYIHTSRRGRHRNQGGRGAEEGACGLEAAADDSGISCGELDGGGAVAREGFGDGVDDARVGWGGGAVERCQVVEAHPGEGGPSGGWRREGRHGSW